MRAVISERNQSTIFNIGRWIKEKIVLALVLSILTVQAAYACDSVSASNLVSSGDAGGPFSPTSVTWTMSNTCGPDYSVTVEEYPAWVTPSATFIVVPNGTTRTLTWTINANANALPADVYSGTIRTSSTACCLSATRTASLTVIDATTTPDAPTALVATPTDGQVSVAFTAPASDGGAAITDYQYQLDGGPWQSAGTTTSPVVITGLTNGTAYSIILRAVNSAGNGTESAAVNVSTPSPNTVFEARKDDTRQILMDDAQRSLASTLATNRRMSIEAVKRFVESRAQSNADGSGLASRNNVPFDVSGFAEASGNDFATRGTFFGQQGNFEGTQRRLFFGDFDIQHDGETGSTTATVTGRIAWEQMMLTETMLGYFVGAELADSTISGAFEGEQTRIAATAGGYVVHALSDALIADGFVTFGAGRNNLDIADDVVSVEGDYTTRTATVGGAITGIYPIARYELRPEIAFSYGKTWIGDVGLTGTAYGLTDNTLSVDADTVSTANLTLRPEFVYGLDGETVAESRVQFSFAPRLICERTVASATTEDCGAGAEIGLSGQSEDGRTSGNIRISRDRIGDNERSSLVLSLEHQF